MSKRDLGASVRQRLLNQAREQGRPFQELLQYYVMQEWIDARKRHHLSHVQVQMARELGMNPMKLGKLDNHEQEPWKMTLREYIEHVYLKRFGKPSPDDVMSIEERLRLAQEKKEARRASRRQLSIEAP